MIFFVRIVHISSTPVHNWKNALLPHTPDPQYDYFVAIFIGVGIAMFMTSTDDLSFDSDVYGEKSSAKWTGVLLLLLFLFFDSFTSQVCP